MVAHERLKFGRIPVGCDLLKRSILFAIDGGHISFAQARCGFDESVEYRLQIERRPADHLEYIGGGCLLLQRFAQFVKKSCVLDRDNRLRGKVFDEINFLLAKRPHLLAVNDDTANQLVVLKHWYSYCRACAAECNRGRLRLLRCVVGTMGHLLCSQDTVENPAGWR